jgi:four helix bundle protein
MTINSYQELLVWQKGMDLVAECYRLAVRLPRVEMFGLTSQIRHAAASVPSNIAEGFGRHHLGDYLRHLSIANGSLKELETHLLIVQRVGYLTDADLAVALQLSQELGRMLNTLSQRLHAFRRARTAPIRTP